MESGGGHNESLLSTNSEETSTLSMIMFRISNRGALGVIRYFVVTTNFIVNASMASQFKLLAYGPSYVVSSNVCSEYVYDNGIPGPPDAKLHMIDVKHTTVLDSFLE